MSLHPLGYLLARRLSPRRIPRAQAVCSSSIVSRAGRMPVAGRQARALQTIRDPEVEGGTTAASNVTDKEMEEISVSTEDKEVTRETMMKLDIEARFEEWMKMVGRRYKDDKERAMRFEIFKKTVKRFESYPGRIPPDRFADRTKEEKETCCCCSNPRPMTPRDRKFLDRFTKQVMEKAAAAAAAAAVKENKEAGNY